MTERNKVGPTVIGAAHEYFGQPQNAQIGISHMQKRYVFHYELAFDAGPALWPNDTVTRRTR